MNNRSRWKSFAVASVIALVIALALTACSKESNNADLTAQQAAKTNQAARKKQEQPQDPLAGMVAAVTASKGDLPVDVRFEMAARPEPGKTVDLRIAFAPKADLMGLRATVKPADGLQMSSDLATKFDALKAGEIKDYTVAVKPSGTGIYIVNLELTVTRDTGDNTYVYAIPVAVPEAAQAAATSSAKSTG